MKFLQFSDLLLLRLLACCVFYDHGLRVASSVSKKGAAENEAEVARLSAKTLVPARSGRELSSLRDAIKRGLSPYGSKAWRANHGVNIGVQCQGSGMQVEVGGSTIASVYKPVYKESPKMCGAFCEETEGCVAWSWSTEDIPKNCYPQQSCLWRVSKSNMVSGVKARFDGRWYYKNISDASNASFHDLDLYGWFFIVVDKNGEMSFEDEDGDHGNLKTVAGSAHDSLLWNEELEVKLPEIEGYDAGVVRLRLADGKIHLKSWLETEDNFTEFLAEKKEALFNPYDRVTAQRDQVIPASHVLRWGNGTEQQPFILKRGDSGTVDDPFHPRKTSVTFDRDPGKSVWVNDSLLVKSVILKEVSEDEVGDVLGNLRDALIHAIRDPITLDIFRDPVMASDGFTYERSAMEQWITKAEERNKTPKSPTTAKPLSSVKLSSNYAMRSLVSSVIEKGSASRLVKSAILKEVSQDEVGDVLRNLGDVLIHAIRDPITLDIFRDPVMASDGFTYERSAMEKWITRAEELDKTPKSPSTSEPLSSVKLSSNYAIRSLVSSVIEKVGASRAAAGKIQKRFRGYRLRKAFLGRGQPAGPQLEKQ